VPGLKDGEKNRKRDFKREGKVEGKEAAGKRFKAGTTALVKVSQLKAIDRQESGSMARVRGSTLKSWPLIMRYILIWIHDTNMRSNKKG
jgi:hypothetical protein